MEKFEVQTIIFIYLLLNIVLFKRRCTNLSWSRSSFFKSIERKCVRVKMHVARRHLGWKPGCSLGIIVELCIQSFNFRLIIRSNHLPIIHNNKIGRMSSIERKGVVFDNTNKIEGKSFEHDVRIVVNKIFDWTEMLLNCC